MTTPSVLVTDAAWCWFSDPRAIRHVGARERIYAGFIRSNGDVGITALDPAAGSAEEFILHPELEIDDHNVPSIMVLPDGRLLTFYTEHNGLTFSRRSLGPEDITAWQPERRLPFGDKITYSHPVRLSAEDGRIYLFWRGQDWRPTLSYSDDLGETWQEPIPLIDSRGTRNRPYVKVASDGAGRIDLVFSDGHPGREPTNSLYHFSYSGGTFRRSDGTPLGTIDDLPFDRQSIEPFYDARENGARAWVWDLALDRNGHPVVAYARYPETTDHRYHYARWDGERWQDEELCAAGGWMPRVPDGEPIREPHYSGGLSLDHADPDRLVLSRERDGVFEIESWVRQGNGWQITSITEGSGRDQLRPYVVAGEPGPEPIICWMSGTYRHYTDFDTNLMISHVSHASG